MKVRKRRFTLLEVLIALSLALVILSSLLAAYLTLERSSVFWANQEKKLFSERFFSHRLTEVFNHLVPIDQNKKFFFTSDSARFLSGTTGLTFSYDNGVSLDSTLSGVVLGRLFVDSDGQLILLTWQDRESWPEGGLPSFHREVLMKDVEGLKFQFFQLAHEDTPAGWKAGTFAKEMKNLPGAIRMDIRQAGQENDNTYYFPIPQVLAVVVEK